MINVMQALPEVTKEPPVKVKAKENKAEENSVSFSEVKRQVSESSQEERPPERAEEDQGASRDDLVEGNDSTEMTRPRERVEKQENQEEEPPPEAPMVMNLPGSIPEMMEYVEELIKNTAASVTEEVEGVGQVASVIPEMLQTAQVDLPDDIKDKLVELLSAEDFGENGYESFDEIINLLEQLNVKPEESQGNLTVNSEDALEDMKLQSLLFQSLDSEVTDNDTTAKLTVKSGKTNTSSTNVANMDEIKIDLSQFREKLYSNITEQNPPGSKGPKVDVLDKLMSGKSGDAMENLVTEGRGFAKWGNSVESTLKTTNLEASLAQGHQTMGVTNSESIDGGAFSTEVVEQVPGDRFVDYVSTRIKELFSSGEDDKKVMKVEVAPPNLGEVKITLEMKKNVLHADFQCSSEAGKTIGEYIPSLEETLADCGIQLGSSNIDTGREGSSSGNEESPADYSSQEVSGEETGTDRVAAMENSGIFDVFI